MKNFSPIFLGNWKMNSKKTDATLFFENFFANDPERKLRKQAIVGFALPYTLLDYEIGRAHV